MSIGGISIGFEAIIFIVIGIVLALGFGKLNEQFNSFMRSGPGCLIVGVGIVVLGFLAYYFLF
jgi:hypothetical protein